MVMSSDASVAIEDPSNGIQSTTSLMVNNVIKRMAVGGTGGQPFDSGVNTSGLAVIHVETGCWGNAYINIIKRIHLTFRDGFSTENNIYLGIACHQRNNHRMQFVIAPHDSVQKVLLWADTVCVHAIQFHTQSGMVSPMFGIPSQDGIEPTEFVLDEPNETIVGLFGRFGGIVDKLGLTTGQVMDHSLLPPQVELPCGPEDDDSALVNHDEAGP